MKLLHYSRKVTRHGYGIEEYVVLTEADEDKNRKFDEVAETFRRDDYELSGVHDVDASNGVLPLERELVSQ